MRPIRTFSVRPSLPRGLERLLELAHNYYWCWHDDAVRLFHRLDADLWESARHNPVKMLGSIAQERLEQAASDEGFRAHYDRVIADLDAYMGATATWFRRANAGDFPTRIVYFSLEFGLHESLPLYSGGMGLLAGDHLKSASDLDLPLVGVGLAYQEGYFRQYLNADGWQGETYPINDFHTLPMEPVLGDDRAPVVVSVGFPGRACRARAWKVQVGRVALYLLDANLPENDERDRAVTNRLYGGDVDLRIRQEILLGMGGLRLLQALGIEPVVCHMNEGHAAFMAIERIRRAIAEQDVSFAEAREETSAGNVFTTHTPVPAGIDVFTPELVDAYFGPLYAELRISREEFLGLGRQNSFDQSEMFSMAVLAIRLAARTNGVSKLHGEVSRGMWQGIWPNTPRSDVPIGSITNGVHTLTWVEGHDLAELYDRYLGPRWREDPTDAPLWAGVRRIPSGELWRTHQLARERLVAYARQQVRRQRENAGAGAAEIERAGEVLSPDALTIGFARRFAAYKRALLLFSDPERIAYILGDRERPVQLIVAGKAHPQDMAGRETIRQLIHKVRENHLEDRIVFLEDYNIQVARYLVQGVDLWLTTPRRPLEASGTSGMKVAVNGGLNVSILDGWWCEAYDPGLGWAIGRGEEYQDQTYQDQVESRALYDLLEGDIVPAFYDRGPDGLPRAWIDKMKASIAAIVPRFSTHRMVRDYAETAYLPATRRWIKLNADGAARARDLARWREQVRQHWPNLRIRTVEADPADNLRVGHEVKVTAQVQLGPLRLDDVRVELFYGPVDAAGQLSDGTAVPMAIHRRGQDGWVDFKGAIPCRTSGLWGFGVRAQPRHPDLEGAPPEPGLVVWATDT